MADRPLVTVCIPTYNRPDLLRSSLQSVLWQSLRDIEVIVSDNASTEDIAAVIESMDDPRVVHDRLDTNIGLFGNLTRCLTLGTGKYRYVLHDDDLMLPGNLERKLQFMQQHPSAGMVHSGFRHLDSSAQPIGPSVNWTRLTEDTLQSGHDFIHQSIGLGGQVCVASVMMRSDAVAHDRFDEEDGPYCDLALWLRIAQHNDVGFLPQALSGMLVHAGSASSGFQTIKIVHGRTHVTKHHADVTLQAHGRFVERADLDPAWREELRVALRECDRRLRLRIRVTQRVPAPALRVMKGALGWHRGSRLYDALAVESAYVPTLAPQDTTP